VSLQPTHRRVLAVALWTLAWLAATDVALNLLADPARAASGAMQGISRYLNYGRSIEGKLQMAVGVAGDKPNAIVHAGWIDPSQWAALPSTRKPGTDLLVAVYGQSFAFNAAEAMRRLDGRMTLRLLGGPAAPLSHSFAAYRVDAPLRRADVVVVGILASSMAKADSISALSWTFESPAPFTFPKFMLDHGHLQETAPVLRTEDEFRAAFAERGARWRDFKAQLREHDRGFDAFAFDSSLLDRSALARLVRRGWVANQQQYDGPALNDPANVQTPVALELLRQLKEMTSASGEKLVVVLLHDRGFDGVLEQALGRPLEAMGIGFVSTARLFSSRDPSQFVADGHYTERANQRVAQALWAAVRGNAPNGPDSP
jgi:hypothetical protein